MPVTFYEIKRETLIAIYELLHRSEDKTYWYPRELLPFIDTNSSLGMVAKALESLEEEELVPSRMRPGDMFGEETYSLSDDGILRAEQLTGNADPLVSPRSLIGGADQIVEIDHTSSQASAIGQSLEELERAVRTSNEAFPEGAFARVAALSEITALQRLWSASVVRLQAFQDRARTALLWVSEKAANSAIAESCKHLIKLILGW